MCTGRPNTAKQANLLYGSAQLHVPFSPAPHTSQSTHPPSTLRPFPLPDPLPF